MEIYLGNPAAKISERIRPDYASVIKFSDEEQPRTELIYEWNDDKLFEIGWFGEGYYWNKPDDVMVEMVKVGDAVKTLNDSAFRYANGYRVKKIIIGKNITQIPDAEFAYRDNSQLNQTIILSEGLSGIGSNAFSYSDIRTLTIPSTVKNIGNSAFSECQELTSLIFTGRTQQDLDGFYSEDWGIEKSKCYPGIQ